MIENSAFAQQLKRLVAQQQQRQDSPVKAVQQRQEYTLQEQDEKIHKQQDDLNTLAARVSVLTDKLVSLPGLYSFSLLHLLSFS